MQLLKSEMPHVAEANTRSVQVNGSADYYGACSIEKFNSASSLRWTHEDAAGWMDYVTQFTPGNFWLGDNNVQVWMYEEPYDNWQDTYGSDAVLAFYHSGHGNMDANGVFQCPMGGVWDGRDWAFSNRMNIGDDQVRYQFWSTCLSLRVTGAHNPIRTWHGANRGLRMIFGFETVSIDSGDYGKFFWEEWRKGKSFSQAWLDASWRIYSGQAPSVCACGANQSDAQARLYNERLFNWGSAARNYYEWRWYVSREIRSQAKVASLSELPKELLVAHFAPVVPEEEAVRLAGLFQIGSKKDLNVGANGTFSLTGDKASIQVDGEGRFEVKLGQINYENTDLLETSKARSIADKLIKEYELNKGMELELSQVREGYACGGSSTGAGQIRKPNITDRTFEYRQIINGLLSVSPDAGIVRITVDNDGAVTSVQSSVREVKELVKKRNRSTVAPQDPATTHVASTDLVRDEKSLEAAFDQKLNSLLGGVAVKSANGQAIVSSEIGYDFAKQSAGVVATRVYELDMGNGLKKLYRVTVPLFE